jgi:hypothetical protein
MMRLQTILRALAVGLLAQSVPSDSLAQSTLDRLEQQIRQRVDASGTADGGATPSPTRPAEQNAGKNLGGYLGLVVDDQADRGRGVRIKEVYRGSPAEKAGLRRDDLITSMAGVRVRQMSDMADTLSMFGPGQTVDVDVLRGGTHPQVRVVLEQRPTVAARQRLQSPEVLPLPRGQTVPPPPAPQLEPSKADETPADASRLERLERRLDALERRLEKLERAVKSVNQK